MITLKVGIKTTFVSITITAMVVSLYAKRMVSVCITLCKKILFFVRRSR